MDSLRTAYGVKKEYEIELSEREKQVVGAIISGCSDHAEIAKSLGIAPQTAQAHTNRIRLKLRIKKFIDLALWAQAHADEF